MQKIIKKYTQKYTENHFFVLLTTCFHFSVLGHFPQLELLFWKNRVSFSKIHQMEHLSI
jgi:hypothetical protein